MRKGCEGEGVDCCYQLLFLLWGESGVARVEIEPGDFAELGCLKRMVFDF